jgi:hypothetical protein
VVIHDPSKTEHCVRASVGGICRPAMPVVTQRLSASRITSGWFERCAPHQAKPARTRPTDESELMGDKSPKKQNVKKPTKSLKEKRADKQSKREDKRPGFGH